MTFGFYRYVLVDIDRVWRGVGHLLRKVPPLSAEGLKIVWTPSATVRGDLPHPAPSEERSK